MTIHNLIGKGGRIRTIKIPTWAESALREWLSISSTDRVFALSPTMIRKIVAHYSKLAGVDCAPHDLRRTFARLSREGGAPLEAIQHSLGHASIRTTELYMRTGEEANGGDYIRIDV